MKCLSLLCIILGLVLSCYYAYGSFSVLSFLCILGFLIALVYWLVAVAGLTSQDHGGGGDSWTDFDGDGGS